MTSDVNVEHIQSASISSPVTIPEPTSPPSQDRQSAGPRLTGAGAGGGSRCEPSLRTVSETSGTWYPRRVLKSESRRMCFAGDSDATLVVDVAAVLVVVVDKMERAVVLVEEGVGETARTAGVAEVFAASRRGTSVRMSPVESTDGGLSGEPSALDQRKGSSGWGTLTLTRQWAMVACAGVPASGENTRGPRAFQ